MNGGPALPKKNSVSRQRQRSIARAARLDGTSTSNIPPKKVSPRKRTLEPPSDDAEVGLASFNACENDETKNVIRNDENSNSSQTHDKSREPRPYAPKAGNKISVAVVGDVGTDWSFISRLPSRPIGETKYPWTQHPAIHLFAVPGGAWFSGHMVQGALAAPIFDRTYYAIIASSPPQSSTLVTVNGNLDWSPHLRQPNDEDFRITVTIADLNHGQCSRPVLILDDSQSIATTDISAVEIHIPWKHFVRSSHIEIGIVNAVLLFDREDTLSPGQITCDPIGRCYNFHNMQVQPLSPARKTGLGFDCTHLALHDLPCTVKTRSKGGRIDEHGKVRSVRLVNDAIRRGEPTDERTIQVTSNAVDSSLFLESGTIDVSFGRLAITARTTDRGKLNSPSSIVNLAESSGFTEFHGESALTESFEWNRTSEGETCKSQPEDSAANPDGQQRGGGEGDAPLGIVLAFCDSDAWAPNDGDHLTAKENKNRLALSPLGGRHTLWFYKNPGARISMQHPAHLVHTLSEIGLRRRTDMPAENGHVYRRVEMRGVDGPRHGYPTILDHYEHTSTVMIRPRRDETNTTDAFPVWQNDSNAKVVVVDDLGYGFCGRPDHWAPFLCPPKHSAALASHLTSSHPLSREIIGDCTAHMSKTWVIVKCSHWLNADVLTLLTFLKTCNVHERTIVVVSGESLRTGFITTRDRPGIKLSKTVSWERTFDDFRSALCDGRLDSLTVAKHLIVRLGLEGALHWERRPTGNRESDREIKAAGDVHGRLSLFFEGERIEGEYAPTETFGEFPGLTTVLVAALTQKLVLLASREVDFENDVSAQLRSAIKFGMRCVRRYFDLGYGPTPETVRKFERLQLPITQIFGHAPLEGIRDSGLPRFHEFGMTVRSDENAGTIALNASTAGGKDRIWSILSRQLDMSSPRSVGLDTKDGFTPGQVAAATRGITALRLARDIVISGSKAAMSRSGLEFPYARFGELLAVDRREIEGFRAIRNLFSEYIGHSERRAPLSIAVFGPPGSGKSFGVQQIARQVASHSGIKELVFNLSQFASYQDVSRLLLQVRDVGLENCLPLVFFDEFDSTLNSQSLGWLRYFLSPMQDGRFQHDGSMLGIGKAIFVFAGGIASTHDEFISDDFWRERTPGGASGGIFTAAKGPDFHSRLRGYLEIVGPNSVPDDDKVISVGAPDRLENEDFSYIVRRALLVRQHIEKMAKTEPTILDANKCAEVDRDVLDALLLVEEYKHGVRSLQAIVEMSALHGARTFSKTSLPSPGQCLMHVDHTFNLLLTRSHTQLTSIILRAICAWSNSPGVPEN